MTQTVKDLVAHIEATPGVVAATPIESGPFKGEALFVMQLVPADRPASANEAAPGVPFEFVGPDYFPHIPDPDPPRARFPGVGRERGPVVQSWSARRWPADSGRIRTPSASNSCRLGDYAAGCTVVGVASDTHYRELKKAGPVAYFDWEQNQTHRRLAHRRAYDRFIGRHAAVVAGRDTGCQS